MTDAIDFRHLSLCLLSLSFFSFPFPFPHLQPPLSQFPFSTPLPTSPLSFSFLFFILSSPRPPLPLSFPCVLSKTLSFPSLPFPFLVSCSPLLFLTRCFLSPPTGPYLGNQLLSYGQDFSFSLRLDRGVRHPSTHDVILEGAGLRVTASLGDLRSIVPCGQKIKYSFRSENQPAERKFCYNQC